MKQSNAKSILKKAMQLLINIILEQLDITEIFQQQDVIILWLFF